MHSDEVVGTLQVTAWADLPLLVVILARIAAL
jgi:hypothetical protein